MRHWYIPRSEKRNVFTAMPFWDFQKIAQTAINITSVWNIKSDSEYNTISSTATLHVYCTSIIK